MDKEKDMDKYINYLYAFVIIVFFAVSVYLFILIGRALASLNNGLGMFFSKVFAAFGYMLSGLLEVLKIAWFVLKFTVTNFGDVLMFIWNIFKYLS